MEEPQQVAAEAKGTQSQTGRKGEAPRLEERIGVVDMKGREYFKQEGVVNSGNQVDRPSKRRYELSSEYDKDMRLARALTHKCPLEDRKKIKLC